jgi:hypothetical protein
MTSPSTASERLERRSAAARRLASAPAGTCEHLHDTTTRYDHAEKVLTFLLVCHSCRTESVIETLAYEPRFEPLEQERLAA